MRNQNPKVVTLPESRQLFCISSICLQNDTLYLSVLSALLFPSPLSRIVFPLSSGADLATAAPYYIISPFRLPADNNQRSQVLFKIYGRGNCLAQHELSVHPWSNSCDPRAGQVMPTDLTVGIRSVKKGHGQGRKTGHSTYMVVFSLFPFSLANLLSWFLHVTPSTFHPVIQQAFIEYFLMPVTKL